MRSVLLSPIKFSPTVPWRSATWKDILLKVSLIMGSTPLIGAKTLGAASVFVSVLREGKRGIVTQLGSGTRLLLDYLVLWPKVWHKAGEKSPKICVKKWYATRQICNQTRKNYFEMYVPEGVPPSIGGLRRAEPGAQIDSLKGRPIIVLRQSEKASATCWL